MCVLNYTMGKPPDPARGHPMKLASDAAVPRSSVVSRPDTVAVFMPTWRCRSWLSRAIESVLAQTWPCVDLYVADDGGDDLDQELLRRHPEVTFLRLRERGGPYRIANLLLAITASDFVAFHDADDRSRPDRLAVELAFLEERGLDGCGSWYRMLDVHGDPIGFSTPPEDASGAMRLSLGDQLLHPTSIYRREVFDRTGGFDQGTLFSGDTEFHYRASQRFVLGNVQRFLYDRTVRPDSLTQDPPTAISSPAREAYLSAVRAAAQAIIDGTAEPPADGTDLLGRSIQRPSTDVLDWVRPGRGNRTLKEGA